MVPPSFRWHVEPIDERLVSLVLRGGVGGQTIENRCACNVQISDTVQDAATRLSAWAWIRSRDDLTTIGVVDDDGAPLRTIVHRGVR